MIRTATLAATVLLALAPGQAFAWGSMGHRIVGVAAMRALPSELPAFLRTPQAVDDVGEYSREPDRWKGAGRIHDHNRDAGHFLDLDDEGKLLGGPAFAPLPNTRADYEKALQAAGLDSWKAGYLPFSIVDQQQQLTKDFAYWRVVNHALAKEKIRARRAWLARDLQRREDQILRTIGELSHYVGDGTQPLHVSVHYNGWGSEYPNPQGYTNAKIHGAFEGDLVKDNVKPEAVRAAITPLRKFTGPIERETVSYLSATGRLVIPLYELEKAGGLKNGDPRGTAFVARQLAVGASELRDMIYSAWVGSLDTTMGWPITRVEDVLSGKVDAYVPLYGKD